MPPFLDRKFKIEIELESSSPSSHVPPDESSVGEEEGVGCEVGHTFGNTESPPLNSVLIGGARLVLSQPRHSHPRQLSSHCARARLAVRPFAIAPLLLFGNSVEFSGGGIFDSRKAGEPKGSEQGKAGGCGRVSATSRKFLVNRLRPGGHPGDRAMTRVKKKRRVPAKPASRAIALARPPWGPVAERAERGRSPRISRASNASSQFPLLTLELCDVSSQRSRWSHL